MLIATSCATAALPALLACSSSEAPTVNAGGGHSNGGATSESGSGGTQYILNGASGEAAGADDFCVSSTSTAKMRPLDLFLTVDVSGSMRAPVSATQSKWQAIREAIAGFAQTSASGELSMALQYFPLRDTCASDSDCGPQGPCLLKTCEGSTLRPCSTNSECGSSKRCIDLGQCSAVDSYCTGSDISCGLCKPLTSSVCVEPACDSEVYAAPAVELSLLPAGAENILSSLQATEPVGLSDAETPARPALEGAIAAAAARANAQPERTAIAVLATDGVPNACQAAPAGNTQELEEVASAGLAASPSIRTFVIGVFSPQDVPAAFQDSVSAFIHARLDPVARAGGTDQVMAITAGSSLSSDFAEALDQVRTALACEYSLPEPEAGKELDWLRVNVRLSDSDGVAETVLYVEAALGCDASGGGWHYDVNPDTGEEPSKIIMCPKTCQRLKSGNHQVDIALGCRTQTAPIR